MEFIGILQETVNCVYVSWLTFLMIIFLLFYNIGFWIGDLDVLFVLKFEFIYTSDLLSDVGVIKDLLFIEAKLVKN